MDGLGNEYGWYLAASSIDYIASYYDDGNAFVTQLDNKKILENSINFVGYLYDFDADIDIQDWEGICVIYESTLAVQVYVGSYYYTKMPPTLKGHLNADGTYLNMVNVRWEDFKLEAGAEDILETDAAPGFSFFMFSNNINPSDPVNDYFNLISIGRYGSCSE